MDIELLRSIAEQLGMKGFKRKEKDDLIYEILDEEARQLAVKAPEKEQEKKRRGRPKKEDVKPTAADKPKKEEAVVVELFESAPENAEKPSDGVSAEGKGRKRSRKSKQEVKPASEAAEAAVTAASNSAPVAETAPESVPTASEASASKDTVNILLSKRSNSSSSILTNFPLLKLTKLSSSTLPHTAMFPVMFSIGTSFPSMPLYASSCERIAYSPLETILDCP